MNCYEWAAGVDIRCSIETDISHGDNDYLLMTATGTSANPKNKLASELTRKQLICKEINEPNIFLRQGIGCFDRWKFDGNLHFDNAVSVNARENLAGEIINHEGIFSISLLFYKVIYRADGSYTRVRIDPIFSQMQPWDTSDPYYNIAYRYWAKDDFEIDVAGGLSFPDGEFYGGLDPLQPFNNLGFFTMKRTKFKFGVTNFELKSLSPLTAIIETVGNATLNLSIQ